jgi:site-specific recombinase XerD
LNGLRKNSEGSRYVFVSERRGKLSPAGVQKMLERLAPVAGLNIKVHPHMLRHAAGYKFANEGKDTRSLQLWLGHRNISHSVRYTQLSNRCFKGW